MMQQQLLDIMRRADQAQSNRIIKELMAPLNTANDQSWKWLRHNCILFASKFNTTFVKHFIASNNGYDNNTLIAQDAYVAGYANTTSAINASSDFKFESSGNIDDGIIKMYGVAKS
jgi:hypothetical protein